jgi:serine/threonine protein kinase
MDYVPGLNLSDEMRLKSSTYTLATRLFILSHIANAIRFLEEYHIAHLDLTPSNIIVDSNKLIRFIDFG